MDPEPPGSFERDLSTKLRLIFKFIPSNYENSLLTPQKTLGLKNDFSTLCDAKNNIKFF